MTSRALTDAGNYLEAMQLLLRATHTYLMYMQSCGVGVEDQNPKDLIVNNDFWQKECKGEKGKQMYLDLQMSWSAL